MSKRPGTGEWSRREMLARDGHSGCHVRVRRSDVGRTVISARCHHPHGLERLRPDELTVNAILFHEHMSMAPDMLKRLDQYTVETSAANGTPPVVSLHSIDVL